MLFEKRYTASSIIKSDLKTVWDILYNLDDYHAWNPFTPKIETDWEIGSKVTLTVNMKTGKTPIIQTDYLTKLNPQNEIAWGMKWTGFLKAERIQRLTSLHDSKIQYFTEDVITGILSPLVHILYGKNILRGFEQVADSLKTYAEKS